MSDAFKASLFYTQSDFEPNFFDTWTHQDTWLAVADLFQTNFIDKKTSPLPKIPKKIHQIWLGSSLPEGYRAWCQSWKKFHPDWDYHLWDEKEILALGLQNEEAFRLSPSFGVKSDLARYEILDRMGGLYVDTDFECLGPFDKLFEKTNFFGGIAFSSEPEVCNALMASCPEHPILKNIVSKLHTPVKTWDSMSIISTTGPRFLTKVILEGIRANPEGIVLFPSQYFYPLPNYMMGTVDPIALKASFAKPFSLGIHYWETSWFHQSARDKIGKMLKSLIPIRIKKTLKSLFGLSS